MRKLFLSASVLLSMATGGLAAIVPGAVQNPSFETGNFAPGWTATGASTTPTALPSGITPTDGTRHARTSTQTGAVSAANLETFLGIPALSLTGLGNGNAIEGSGFKQTLTVNDDESLIFNWNFASNDTVKNDFAVLTIVGTSFSQVIELTDNNTASPDYISGLPDFLNQTGWQSGFYFPFPGAGTYTVGFAVVDVVDNGGNSGLFVDAVNINLENPVPEPTVATSAILLLGGMALRRSRRVA